MQLNKFRLNLYTNIFVIEDTFLTFRYVAATLAV